MLTHDLSLLNARWLEADELAKRRSGARGKEAREGLVRVEEERVGLLDR